MAPTKRPLPKLADLHHDVEKAFQHDELNLLLNQPPHESWIKKHPMITVKDDTGKQVKLQYIPIDKIEFMLTRIFQQWKREVMQVQLILNTVVVTVRLWVLNPITGEWSFHDGVGGSPVQTDKDAAASNLAAIKTAGVQIAAPAAVSYALKDAAECLGKLFGKDLNKWGTAKFSGAYMGNDDLQSAKQVIETELEKLEEEFKPVTQSSIKAKYTPPADDNNDFDL